MGSFADRHGRGKSEWNGSGITRREALGLAAIGLIAGAPRVATAAGPQGQLTWGIHVSLAPTWFDPAETPGLITPSHGAGLVNWLFGHADSLLGSDLGSSRLLTCSTRAAEPHIRSPLRAADTKIPHTRGHRAREDGTNLYGGILQPGRYAAHPPRSDEGFPSWIL